MLRGLLKRPGLPEAVKLALRLESGLNDIVLLPIVLVAMAFLSQSNLNGIESARLGLELFLLGPGVVVGSFALGALELVRLRAPRSCRSSGSTNDRTRRAARQLERRILCLTRRSYQHPWGARTSASRMVSGPCANRRLGRMAGHRPAHRNET
jgi:hypothetical protein